MRFMMQKACALSLTSDKKNPYAPNVRAFIEQGYKNMIHKGYYAFFAPVRMAREIVVALCTALVVALKDKEILAGLAQSGMSAMSTSPQEAARLLKQDRAKWQAIVKQVGYVAT